jgi:hypothetical protein
MRKTDFDKRSERLLKMIPKKELDRVLNQKMCDITPAFMGFIDAYEALAKLIPLHWTVVDLGCAYAPQAYYFTKHKKYIGVDDGSVEHFKTSNSEFYTPLKIYDYINSSNFAKLDLDETFAILNYVPPWYHDNCRLVRGAFKNLYVFYPHGTGAVNAN